MVRGRVKPEKLAPFEISLPQKKTNLQAWNYNLTIFNFEVSTEVEAWKTNGQGLVEPDGE